MNTLLTLALLVYLKVSAPVAAIQIDLTTTGNNVQLVGQALSSKQITSARQPNGTLRVIIFGLNQSTFNGQFMTVDASVTATSNLVAANPDSTQANVTVLVEQEPRPPQNLTVK